MVAIRHGCVRLREISSRDLSAIHAYAADPEVARFLQYGVWTKQETHRQLATMIEHRARQPRYRYYLAIIPSGARRMIGTVTLEVTSRLARECFVGVTIRRSMWGRGFASHACEGLFGWAFEELQMHRICAKIAATNARSIRLFKGMGFVQEGVLREAFVLRGSRCDALLFSRLRHESGRR